MLRLTVTLVQVLDDCVVHAAVHQEDPYDGTTAVLGDSRKTYPMADLLETYDELTALLLVLSSWSDGVALSTKRSMPSA